MIPEESSRRLLLCLGAQSSGSTLISWCFLQRRDTDGVLDRLNDVLEEVPAEITAPIIWIKATLGCFGVEDLLGFYSDRGIKVEPLLVVRDLRTVFASLMTKSYGRNATTAEDPPLRMRIRRFLADWELFCRRGWPIVKFESVVGEPRRALTEACTALGLEWDEGMLSWPKSREDFADSRFGNSTFFDHLGDDLASSLRLELAAPRWGGIPEDDLVWLEHVAREFNRTHGYPGTVTRVPGENPPGRLCESLGASRRSYWLAALDEAKILQKIRQHKILYRLVRLMTASDS